MKQMSVNMPEDVKKQCVAAIHTATAAAGAAGAIPIPIADTIPITATQVAMAVALGKVFDVSLNETLAQTVIKVGVAQGVGRAVFSEIMKAIPGVGAVVGGAIAAGTAVTITEALGWMLAEDFYLMSLGQEPKYLQGNLVELTQLFQKSDRESDRK